MPEIDATTTAHFFYLINRVKQSNFIQAELENGSELSFVIENLPKNNPQDGCPGWWMLKEAIDHFLAFGPITGLQGNWVATASVPSHNIVSDNIKALNALTAGGGLTIEQAAVLTWTGRQADRVLGFRRVRQRVPATGTPGNYTSVHVLFY